MSGDKLQTLVMMYRAHCQRIMDSINKFSFTEVMRGCSVGDGQIIDFSKDMHT